MWATDHQEFIDSLARDGTQWLYGMRPGYVEQIKRILAEPGPKLADFERVSITIEPRGGPSGDVVGPPVTLVRIIPRRGGVEALRFHLDKMVSQIIEGKSKSYEHDLGQFKEE